IRLEGITRHEAWCNGLIELEEGRRTEPFGILRLHDVALIDAPDDRDARRESRAQIAVVVVASADRQRRRVVELDLILQDHAANHAMDIACEEDRVARRLSRRGWGSVVRGVETGARVVEATEQRLAPPACPR